MNSYPIDRCLAAQHLEYLGYKPGDSVYLRFFYHTSDPRKNDDSGRKLSKLNWEQIEKYQSDGRGVYVVVNGAGGGHSDADIKQCCAIFCEWDDIPLAEQFEKWSELEFVEPTFTVFSGDKSMQPYWVFDEPIAVEQWRELQELLITVMGADKSNKNPSRVFRLAGGWHIKPEREPVKSEMVGNSGIRYSYGELCDRLLDLSSQVSAPTPTLESMLRLRSATTAVPTTPTAAAPTTTPTAATEEQNTGRYKDITIPVPMSISLGCALGKAKQFLSGVSTLRNTSMAILARDLIGTAAEFQHLGQMTNDDAYTLFVDACRHCSPGGGWSEREWEQIWASAVRSNPGASILQASPDAVENCIKGEYWRSVQGGQKSIEQNKGQNATERLTTRKTEISDVAKLEAEIDELLTADLKASQIHISIVKLSQKYRLGSKDIWRIYHARSSENEQEETIEDTAIEVAQLLASGSASLKLSEILPESLALPIEKLAGALNLKPEGYLLALLVQSASLLKAGTSTMLYPQSAFRCNPNYFGANVSESSQKKTPIVRAIVNDPMEKLYLASEQEYKAAKLAYEEALACWKGEKDAKNPMPIEPIQKVYCFTKATSEGITAQAQKMPQQSMLFLCDELAGAFKSANQYRGGKGSDEEDLLEYWSGGGSVVLRAGGLATNVRNVSLSILGNIQPKVLAGFVGDGDDSNGKFARFDFVQQPLAATELEEDAPSIDLTPMLTAIYEKLDALPVQNFTLSREARKLFISFYNHCERERVKHSKQGMRAMLGKAPLKVGKLATILHCIYAAHSSGEISQSIPISTVRAAIKFAKFTIDQALSLNLEMCSGDEIAPNLAKIASLADRKGGTVSIREIRDSFNSKYRPATHQIREWFSQLVKMGYGQIAKLGKTLSFIKCPQRPTFSQNPGTAQVSGVPSGVQNNVQNESILDVNKSSSHSFAMTYRPASYGLESESNSPPVQSTESNSSSETSNLDNIGRYLGRESGLSQPAPAEAPESKLDTVDALVTKDATEGSDSEELVNFIRTAIAEGDRTIARDIQSILKEVCGNGGADRVKVWSMLTEAEKIAFTALLADEEPLGSQEPEQSEQTPLIDPIDAEKIRDIALIWWNEFYPEQLQSLIVQMFGWEAPGTKYDAITIRGWLETEGADIRDRINQLINFKNSSFGQQT